jgi:acyl-CoA thioesterase FadM
MAAEATRGGAVHEDEYTIIEDVTGDPGPAGGHHHMVDYQTQELLSTLWSKYLAQAREGLAPTGVTPAMRRVSYSLESEAFSGEPLQRGIRMATRSRRSCTFSAGLWHAEDGRMVHSAEMVTVFVEPAQGSVAVPDDFWAAVEKIEGRSIPVAERQA